LLPGQQKARISFLFRLFAHPEPGALLAAGPPDGHKELALTEANTANTANTRQAIESASFMIPAATHEATAMGAVTTKAARSPRGQQIMKAPDAAGAFTVQSKPRIARK
jgi:hypothetical protein